MKERKEWSKDSRINSVFRNHLIRLQSKLFRQCSGQNYPIEIDSEFKENDTTVNPKQSNFQIYQNPTISIGVS